MLRITFESVEEHVVNFVAVESTRFATIQQLGPHRLLILLDLLEGTWVEHLVPNQIPTPIELY